MTEGQETPNEDNGPAQEQENNHQDEDVGFIADPNNHSESDRLPTHVGVWLRKNRRVPKEQALAVVGDYINTIAHLPSCYDIQGRSTKCTCLSDCLVGEAGAAWVPFVAEFLLEHCLASAKIKNDRIVESTRMLLAGGNSLLFPLPAKGKPPERPLAAICRNSYFLLLGVRKKKFQALLKAAKTNTALVNGLSGRKSNHSIHQDMTTSLISFFDDMVSMAAPRATRFVRMETGTELRDEDEELSELPSHWTKRRLYGKWCESRGYKMSLKNAKGAIQLTQMDSFDGEPQKCCVLTTFLSFWKKHYPKLVLPKSREDICTECFILSHTFRYYATRNSNRDSESDDEDESANRYEHQEQAIKEARLHVERAEAQREYFRAISRGEGDVLVMDYMQNLGLPHLGAEQAGATYYYSPLNVYGFGVVNMRTNKLTTFVYNEGEGKKGGNNVASLIMKYLTMESMLQRDSEGKPIRSDSLQIVMDNCSGQNKNRMVLRLALYLVELGFYRKVEFVFLVVGHTKNPCDRMFNLLKQSFRKSNIYTMSQLLEALNEHEQTTAVEYSSFQDWDKYLDRLYKRFQPGTVHCSHNFTVDSEKPNEMLIELSRSPEDAPKSTTRNFTKNIRGGLTREQILNEQPASIPKLGIPDIKQIELGTKWRPNVPVEFQDEICPVPPPEVLDKHKKAQSEKYKRKKQMNVSEVEEGKQEEQVDEPEAQEQPQRQAPTQQHDPIQHPLVLANAAAFANQAAFQYPMAFYPFPTYY